MLISLSSVLTFDTSPRCKSDYFSLVLALWMADDLRTGLDSDYDWGFSYASELSLPLQAVLGYLKGATTPLLHARTVHHDLSTALYLKADSVSRVMSSLSCLS